MTLIKFLLVSSYIVRLSSIKCNPNLNEFYLLHVFTCDFMAAVKKAHTNILNSMPKKEIKKRRMSNAEVCQIY